MKLQASHTGAVAERDGMDRDTTQDNALHGDIERLRQEHRDLDAAIAALEGAGMADRLQLQRLKKRKLVLRDRLAYVEDQLTPDIIA